MYSTDESRADIAHRFGYHPPKDQATKDAHENWRSYCRELALYLDYVLPPGREKSLALTHLEDSLMWGNAAIARAVSPR